MTRDLLAAYEAFVARGERVGRAVVTAVSGSAPQPAGATLLATEAGAIAGSISGGCVESDVALAVAEAIRSGTARLASYGITDELAWNVGLPCGGTIDVLIEPGVRPEVLEAARSAEGAVLATVLTTKDESAGSSTPSGHGRGVVASASVVLNAATLGGEALATARSGGVERLAEAETLEALLPRLAAAAAEALEREVSSTLRLRLPTGGTATVFLEVFPMQPRLVIYGAGHIAAELVPLARRVGYRTIVADARRALVTAERFPEADELVIGWPDEAFQRIRLDRHTFVCVLTHDPKLDDPALLAALRSRAALVGAIGSRKRQEARRKRLRAAGVSDADLERLRGPIGLDLGGRRPVETALAILSEIVAARHGGSGRPLSEPARGTDIRPDDDDRRGVSREATAAAGTWQRAAGDPPR